MAAVVFLFCTIIPGYFLARLCNARQYLLLFSITLSYLFVFCLILIANRFSLSIEVMTILFFVFTGVLIISAVLFKGKEVLIGLVQVKTMLSETVSISVPITISILVFLYFALFGVYDEIPSDFYQHLNYATNAYSRLQQHAFGPGSGVNLQFANSKWLYHIYLAWISIVSGVALIEMYPIIMVLSSLIFILSVAACADRLYRIFALSWSSHQVAILCATLFVFAQLGVTVFSYFRYYSLAPTMLNFVVYFAGLICLLDIFEGSLNKIRSMLLLIAAICIASIVHLQEAIFICLTAVLLLFWWLFQEARSEMTGRNKKSLLYLGSIIMLTLGLLTAYVWFRVQNDIQDFFHSKVLIFSFKYIGQLFILDPTYQFYQVITIWGCLVFLLFFIFFKKLSKQPFFVLAMLSPLITMFNPLFADIFVRLGKSTTLWRMSYFIPMHFVGGILVIFLFQKVMDRHIFKRIACSVGLVSLFLLLLPSIFSLPLNVYAKTTLNRVDQANTWHHWQDLIEYMNDNEFDFHGGKNRF